VVFAFMWCLDGRISLPREHPYSAEELDETLRNREYAAATIQEGQAELPSLRSGMLLVRWVSLMPMLMLVRGGV
jgi:hypothetical protein